MPERVGGAGERSGSTGRGVVPRQTGCPDARFRVFLNVLGVSRFWCPSGVEWVSWVVHEFVWIVSNVVSLGLAWTVVTAVLVLLTSNTSPSPPPGFVHKHPGFGAFDAPCRRRAMVVSRNWRTDLISGAPVHQRLKRADGKPASAQPLVATLHCLGGVSTENSPFEMDVS